MIIAGHFHSQGAVRNLKRRARGKKDDQRKKDVSDLEPAIGLASSEPSLNDRALGHPPHHHKTQRHGDAAD
jgi:hypothetical protein